MKPLFVITTLAAMAVSGCMTAPVQGTSAQKPVSESELDLYSLEHQVTHYSKVEFGKNAAKAFHEFRKSDKGYFGAFAYSSGPRGAFSYSATDGHGTLRTAREYALKNCSTYLVAGPACKIIAVLTPKGYVERHKATLSKSSTKALRNLRSADKYNAIATNDAGYVDWVAGYSSQESANKEAMRRCSLRVKTRTQRIQKTYPCYLVPKQ